MHRWCDFVQSLQKRPLKLNVLCAVNQKFRSYVKPNRSFCMCAPKGTCKNVQGGMTGRPGTSVAASRDTLGKHRVGGAARGVCSTGSNGTVLDRGVGWAWGRVPDGGPSALHEDGLGGHSRAPTGC